MTQFFTSDTHFGHKKIIEYSNRPFESMEEHDEKLIARWNETVMPDDLVHHLGDIAITSKTGYVESLLKRLNGQIHVIWGNHDHRQTRQAANVDWSAYYKSMTIQGQRVIMTHCPYVFWPGSNKGSWQLHGHCHGAYVQSNTLTLDVGVDCHDYRPVSFEQVKKLMEAKKNVVFPDHHEPVRITYGTN